MNRKLLFLIAALLFLSGSAATAHAASNSVSFTLPGTLYISSVPVLYNTSVTVSYSATVYDNNTNAIIGQNGSVTANESLRFVFTPHVYTDISWVGYGGSFDTPYGNWVANAGPPNTSGCFVAQNWIASWPWGSGGQEDEWVALNVAPPTETLTNTSGLSCQAPTTDSAGNMTEICTVTGSGSLTPVFNFASTNGIFYYSDARGVGTESCIIHNQQLYDSNSNLYVAPVPADTISYPLTAPPPTNNPPLTPSLTCPASGQTGQALSFTLQGTDPNGDQIRYGMDWTNANSVSEWAPSSGYVPSGTSQTVSHSWATAGTYTIKALSQDINSANSGWSTSCSVTITNPPTPTALLTASPSSVVSGSSATLQWSSTNATSCTGTGFSTGGATSGSVSTGALTSNQTYSVSCTGAGGTASNSATVTVLPPPPASITATCNANGTAVSLSWPAAPGATSYNPRVGGNPIQPQCGQAGWQVWTDGTTCYPNPDVWGQTTVSNFPVNPGQAYSAWVHSGNANGTNWNQSASTNFTCSGQADLTAGNTTLSPGIPAAGTAVTFTATTQNIGTGTSGSFPVLFQVQDSLGNNVSLIDSSYLPALAASASAPASISYTFASAGTYNVRACANENTTMTPIVTESNYGNNCGAWTSVTVPPPPVVTLTCSVSNGTPSLGQQVTYTATGGWGPFPTFTWQASDGWTGTQGVTASTINRTFTTAGQYGMQVTTASGPGTTVTANCPVVTAGTVCTNPTATITANPNRVRVGDTTSIAWSASGINTSCTVSGPGVNQTVAANSCTVGNPPSITTPPITAQSVYTVTCDGSLLNQVIVNVIPLFREF